MGLDGISASLQKLISPATLESLTKAPNCSILSGTCPSPCRQTATCYARSMDQLLIRTIFVRFPIISKLLERHICIPIQCWMDEPRITSLRNCYLWNTISLMIQSLGCLIAFLFHVPIAWSEINVLLQWSWTVEQCQRQWFSPSLFWW